MISDPKGSEVSDKVELTPDEVKYVKRPLTDEERAAIKGMPHAIAEGFVRRKRAQEVADRRGRSNIADAMEMLAEAARLSVDNP